MPTAAWTSRRHLGDVVFLVCFGALLALPPAASAEEHQLFLFVMNQYGLPVGDLRADEVVIEHRGDACEIKSLTPGTDPMTVALMVDDGEGAAQSLNPLREGLNQFLDTLSPEHEVGLFTISGQTTELVAFTTDRMALSEKVSNLFIERGTGVVFLDGLAETWDRRFDDETSWPVFVAIVHGGAEASRSVRERQLDQLANELHMRGANVHTIVVSTRPTMLQVEAAIRITENTGGLYRALAAPTAIPIALTELAGAMDTHYEEVKNRYLVIFECDEDNPRRVQAKVDRPAVAVRTFRDRRMEPAP